VGLWNYIRIANEIALALPAGRLLDWGCAFGQMTWLLRRRGLRVTAFDVTYADFELPDIPLTRHLEIVRSPHPTRLPFEDAAFDAVLSCGVLEHVDEFSAPGNERLSLLELHRVTAPGGLLFIYQLPQRLTWQEAVTRTLRVGYSHPRRYSGAEIARMLGQAGFRVESLRRNNMLPKNLTGLPEAVRSFYSWFGRAIIRTDAVLSRVPILNRVAGVLEVTARRI
jgi:SAM-dependent methyltransferase